jgi:hypothetical protein
LTKALKGLAVDRAGNVLHYHRHRYRLNLVVWKNFQNIFTLSRRPQNVKWAVCRKKIHFSKVSICQTQIFPDLITCILTHINIRSIGWHVIV